MRHELRVTNIRFVPARAADRATGLMGFVNLVLHDDLCVDGISVRRTRGGRYVLSFPTRRDGSGNQHPIVWPLTPAARARIEAEVLSELNRRGFITLPTGAERNAS